MFGFKRISEKLFGSVNSRKIKSVDHFVTKINALSVDMSKHSEHDFASLTKNLSERVKEGGNTLDSILPEAFAVVREAAYRTLGLQAFDTQLLGGIFMHQGHIAEMKTGEGKTLAAVFPAYLHALTGKGVHIVTVNDYLAKRDAEWMGKIYTLLGLTVGVVYPQQANDEKCRAYQADITYATNNELAFDYLRDNMVVRIQDMVQRGHNFSIVDEVDSILIDEARTPLIISGQSEQPSAMYDSINKIILDVEDTHYTLDEKNRNAVFTESGNEFFEERAKALDLLSQGMSLYDLEATTLVHHADQSLKAHTLFKRDKDYVVKNNQVVLIDEFTGRLMAGRRLSNGLHQAIEAKEKVPIQPENVTFASVTFQNYFRLYKTLAGMTGTAQTEAQEFREIYGLDVIDIPTYKPVKRIDENDQIYLTQQDKLNAVVQTIRDAHTNGQPVLVGTVSIERSEELSKRLKKEKLKHNVLNALHHAEEAQIIANAGRIKAITIATNMAGRGTDIQLGGNIEMRIQEALNVQPDADPDSIRRDIEAQFVSEREKVLAAGGLFVLATERHESRRIDNQLRGRAGRQGDPGRSCFYISLEDDLMRVFGSDSLDKVMTRLGMKSDEAIVHPWVNKSLERAQAKVEARNFDIRKQLIKFDDVINDQRKAIFKQRLEIMSLEDLSDILRDMRHQVIDDIVDAFVPENAYTDQWDVQALYTDLLAKLNINVPIIKWVQEEGGDEDELRERLYKVSDQAMAKKALDADPTMMRSIERYVVLETIDKKWREHLSRLEHLRSVIGLRGYAQRDPLNEYKTEAFQLFQALLTALRVEACQKLAFLHFKKEENLSPTEHNARENAYADTQSALIKNNVQAPLAGQAKTAQKEDFFDVSETSIDDLGRKPMLDDGARAIGENSAAKSDIEKSVQLGQNKKKIGRNEPCPCGSGKKYKHCHGQILS